MFATTRGTAHDHRNVAGRALARAVKRAGIDTSTQPAPTMHGLRHGFASAFIATGGDLVELSALLGDRDPAVGGGALRRKRAPLIEKIGAYAAGCSTVSITCTVPLEASTSGCTTVASPIFTMSPCLETVSSPPWIVLIC